MFIPIEIIVALFGAFTLALNSIIAAAFIVVFFYIKNVRDEAKDTLEKEVQKSESADVRITKRQDEQDIALEKAKDKNTENDKQLFIKTEEMRVKAAYELGHVDGLKQGQKKS